MMAHREQSILRQHDKDPQHNEKNVHGIFGVFVCIFDSMLKIFITPSNRELSICDNVRKILSLMTKICMVFFGVFVCFAGIETENQRWCIYRGLSDVVNHINSWCNVVHTEESYAEVFRISFSRIHLCPMFTNIVLIRKIYSGKQRCISDCIFRTASVSWPVVCSTSKTFFKRFLSVVRSRKHVLPRFLTTFAASQPFFDPPSL